MNLPVYSIIGVILLLLVAGLLLAARGQISGSAKAGVFGEDVSPEELFVDVGPETKERLLDDWRWKVGENADVFRVTVFGDIFTQTSDGHIYWLDTGRGHYTEVAGNAEQWAQAVRLHGREWFHWSTLRDLRSLEMKLKEGQVYSWLRSPSLSGAESVDNVNFLSLEVHVSSAGRLAEALKDVPPGTKITNIHWKPLGSGSADQQAHEDGEDAVIYDVVINEELQYSIWPSGQQIPAGWSTVGKRGTKQECLDYIQEVWIDLRPSACERSWKGASE